MSDIRRLPIGVQSFSVLRNEGFVYIDKTEYILKLAAESRVYFLGRPRRFGKSLFLSTLKAYFLGKKELFKGLYIEEAEQRQAEKEGCESWGNYPVLHLDFNAGIYDTRESLINRFLSFFNEYEEIYKSTGLDIPDRFKNLIKKIYETTGRQVVILVDEYDKPLLETMIINEPLNEEYRRILKGFYGVIKSCDDYIRFAFLTGVTKFSKVSIFSDLNNLRDISMLPDYDAVCGITQKEMEEVFKPEIIALGKAQDLTEDETLTKLKQKYDGYHFSENFVNVYNPFSLLNVFAGKVFRSFWFATGTPTFLVRTLEHQKEIYIRDILEDAEMSENALQDYRPDMNNPIPILFQSGYLTIKDYDKEFQLYKLGFPNDEVKYGFLDNLVPAYTSIAKDASGLFIANFVRDIENGKTESFMKRMYAACAGLPYSLASKENVQMRERDYQIAFYIIFSLMGQFVQTEVVSSKGRADCVLHTDDTIYICMK
ncbi:AAA family ATPase [Treponema sp. OMZ 799]|uniref:ATP-binding protein n=1 Tax=Treponema sp. OMZ 799 TaxID=2563668 RepID=UPI0020A5DBE8|nr:ATP-binding protein [Treponema sp. OMZ 799]UTC77526.1 AAA family ATPase [Treponema sp. OMZ 799]